MSLLRWLMLPLLSLLLMLMMSHVNASCIEDCSVIFEGNSNSTSQRLCQLSLNRCQDMSFLHCVVCTSPVLRYGVHNHHNNCNRDGITLQPDEVASFAADAILNITESQGYFWSYRSRDVTASVAFLLQHMPRRDLLLLYTQPLEFIDFLLEHVRYALLARTSIPSSRVIPWSIFLNDVLPYSIINEKRDIFSTQRWRPKLWLILSPLIAKAQSNSTAKIEAIVDAIPSIVSEAAMGIHGDVWLYQPFTWKTGTAPENLSVSQVARHGGSCTGTAVVLAAALRTIGIPARVTGCGESIIEGDDHHWVEFYNMDKIGPFGDYWHTKEGVSSGNAGGPWDSLSTPMRNCLRGVSPKSSMHSLWSSSFQSNSFFPTLWASSPWSQTWSHVGGINRCGAYCFRYGCGHNNTMKWKQEECYP